MGTIESNQKEFEIKMGVGEITTNILTGNLNSIIIDSEEYVSITIESSLGYLIFHEGQIKGISYNCPRAAIRGAIRHLAVNDQFDKFKLNESLNIRVSGPSNAEVTIIIRID